ncbi:MAG TPA: cyclic nucleotide-binding domain-containing protein, partial [archaeon]|nr:cyclic nucleotide-binding domain-containing protein [archaeon]
MSLDIAGVLANCSFFSRVHGASRKRLVRMALPRAFKKGEVIFREGDPAPGIYIVGEGLVRIYKLAATGKEHVLHLAGPGMTFAEVAVFGGFPCPATAEAVEDTACILLPADPLRATLQE